MCNIYVHAMESSRKNHDQEALKVISQPISIFEFQKPTTNLTEVLTAAFEPF